MLQRCRMLQEQKLEYLPWESESRVSRKAQKTAVLCSSVPRGTARALAEKPNLVRKEWEGLCVWRAMMGEGRHEWQNGKVGGPDHTGPLGLSCTSPHTHQAANQLPTPLQRGNRCLTWSRLQSDPPWVLTSCCSCFSDRYPALSSELFLSKKIYWEAPKPQYPLM